MERVKMKYFNATQFAEKLGVSKQRVVQWIKENRISCWMPGTGSYLIPETEKRPEPMKPGRPTNYLKSLVFDK
jgi:excisionase family DNA binding protein